MARKPPGAAAAPNLNRPTWLAAAIFAALVTAVFCYPTWPGFITPSFNRLPDVWEIGDVADVRVFVNHVQNGNTTTNYEALVFPFQIAGNTGLLRAIFVGAAVDAIPYVEDNKKYAVGVTGRLLDFTLSGVLYWNLTNGTAQVTLGFIRRM